MQPDLGSLKCHICIDNGSANLTVQSEDVGFFFCSLLGACLAFARTSSTACCVGRQLHTSVRCLLSGKPRKTRRLAIFAKNTGYRASRCQEITRRSVSFYLTANLRPPSVRTWRKTSQIPRRIEPILYMLSYRRRKSAVNISKSF